MGNTRLAEYQAGMYLADKPETEFITSCRNVNEARRWCQVNHAKEYGQADVVKVVLWPQTARAKQFCAGRGDYIEVTKEQVTFKRIS